MGVFGRLRPTGVRAEKAAGGGPRVGRCCQPSPDIQLSALLLGDRKLLLFPFCKRRGRGPERVWDLPEVTQYKVAESEIGLESPGAPCRSSMLSPLARLLCP